MESKPVLNNDWSWDADIYKPATIDMNDGKSWIIIAKSKINGITAFCEDTGETKQIHNWVEVSRIVNTSV